MSTLHKVNALSIDSIECSKYEVATSIIRYILNLRYPKYSKYKDLTLLLIGLVSLCGFNSLTE